jgi:hypothetical protein
MWIHVCILCFECRATGGGSSSATKKKSVVGKAAKTTAIMTSYELERALKKCTASSSSSGEMTVHADTVHMSLLDRIACYVLVDSYSCFLYCLSHPFLGSGSTRYNEAALLALIEPLNAKDAKKIFGIAGMYFPRTAMTTTVIISISFVPIFTRYAYDIAHATGL